MKIELNNFGGIIPKLDPKLLPEISAQDARNLFLGHGTLKPIRDDAQVESGHSAGKIYKYRNKDTGTEWLSFAGTDPQVSIIKSPIAQDKYDRIYLSGYSANKLYEYSTHADFGAGPGGYRQIYATDVNNKVPPAIAAITLADLVDEEQDLSVPDGMRLEWYFPDTPANSVDSELVKIEKTSTGYSLLFKFPGAIVTGLGGAPTDPYFRFMMDFNDDSGGTLTFNFDEIGEKKAVRKDNGVDWAFPELTRMEPRDIGLYAAGTWTAPAEDEMQVVINMNYEHSCPKNIFYTRTYVNDLGEESPIGEISELVLRECAQRLTLPAIASGDVDSTVEKMRIYRTGTGESVDADNFYFVAEISKSSGAFPAYIDWVKDGDLSTKLVPRENPPDGLEGIVLMPGQFAAGYKDRTVCFSEPFLVHSWPAKYQITVDAEIMALGVSGNDLIVLTKGNPELISGSHPVSMRKQKLMIDQSCVDRNAVCQAGHAVYYAAPDGIIKIFGGQAQLVTAGYITKDQWHEYIGSNDNVWFASFDGKLHCYIRQYIAPGNVNFLLYVFDFGTEPVEITQVLGLEMGTLYTDMEDDSLYFVDGISGSNIRRWNDYGEDAKTLLWKSRQYGQRELKKPVSWTCARVLAESYPVSPATPIRFDIMKYGAGGAETNVFTKYVYDRKAFRLPIHDPAETWAVRIMSEVEIFQIALATSTEEIQR